MKRFKTLDKGWKEVLYAMSGFGPNMLMILMGAYYSDAVHPNALIGDARLIQSIAGVTLISPLIYPALALIAKIFDGVIDVPLGHLTDNLKTKWGKRRLPIAICFLPMIISFACLWIPVFGIDESAQLGNTIWFVVMSFIFFASYTMNLIAFYGSLSTVCYDDAQRGRVSSFKAFFDTINYVVCYALIPLILSSIYKNNPSFNIGKLVLFALPLMCTILIPVFMIKEGDKWEAWAIEQGYDVKPLAEEETVGIVDSIKSTMLNKPFLRWNIVNSVTYFGLQMFLVSMNALIVGLMGLKTIHMTILNTFAFAPIPLMLYLFNKSKKRFGIRATYQSCLICFAICILGFLIGSEYVLGEGNYTIKVIIGAIGGVCGSWALGSFFMLPLLIPAQVSSVEEKLTGRNQSAMYFAGQALFTCVIGAVAAFVYDFLKNFFVTKDFSRIIKAESKLIMEGDIAIGKIEAREVAAGLLNVDPSQVFCLGTLLVPIIVSITCIIGAILARKMCKNYTPEEVAADLGMSEIYEEKKHLFPVSDKVESKKESVALNCALWVLSGSIFSVVWRYNILKRVNDYRENKIKLYHWIIGVFVPPYAGILLYQTGKEILAQCEQKGVKCSKAVPVLSLVFGLLGIGLIPAIIQTIKLNKLESL